MKMFLQGTLAIAFALTFSLLAQADTPKLIEKTDKEPSNDKEFLAWAIACEVAEVKFAELAAKHASNPDVKKFAETQATEHKKVSESLLEQAKKHKMAVVEGLEKKHREEYNRLSKLEGAEFDREYLEYVLTGHEKGSKLYKKWAKDSTDAEIRSAADSALSQVQTHMDQAKKLKERLAK